MADINSQMGASLQQAEMARQRAMADMQRQVDEMHRRSAWHQSISDRAAQAGRAVGGAAMGAGAHFYSNAATGAAFTAAQLERAQSVAGAAIGMSGFQTNGPMARGIPGPYLSSGQSFGGLMYDAGLGSALNAATGNLFFRDANQVLGMPQGMVRQMAQDEMSLRMNKVVNVLGQALPFSDALGMRFNDIRDVTQRDVARRFSYLTGQASSMSGGRGVSSTGALASGIARSLEDAGERFDRARGYSVSKEEELDIRNATLNMMSSTQGQKFATMSASQRDSDIRKMRNVVHQMMDNLRVSAKEAAEITQEFGEFFSPEQMGQMSRAVQTAISSGAGGSLTGIQLQRMLVQSQRAGLQMGMSDSQAMKFGETFLNERGAILAQRRSGLLSYGDMFMYGGSNADEAAALMAQANRRLGLQYGADPAIGMMYANKNGVRAMNDLAAGSNQGGIFGFMTSQANVAASDPYAALRARFDPQAKERQATTGLLAAFNQARQVADFNTVFGPGADTPEGKANRRAVAIAEFARSAGIKDDVEAARQYDRLARAEKMLGGPKQAFIYNQMQQLAPYAMDADEARGVTERVLQSVGGDINKFMEKPEYERKVIVEKARRFKYGATEADKEEYIAAETRKGRALGLAAGISTGVLTGNVAAGVGASVLFTGAVGAAYRSSAESRVETEEGQRMLLGLDKLDSGFGENAVGAAAALGVGAAFGPVGLAVGGAVAIGMLASDSEEDIEVAIKKAMRAGISHHDLNAMLSQGGVNNFIVTANGDLRDRDNPNDTNASTRFGRADKLKEVLSSNLEKIRKTGKLDESVIRGAGKEKAADQIRAMSSKSDTDFLAEADVVSKVGMRRDEAGNVSISDESALLSDPEILDQVRQAAFEGGQTDLYEKLKSEDLDAGVALNMFMKSANNTSMENLQYLRGSRVASSLASTRGQTETNPMYVKVTNPS